jgi:hypothetical protein
MGPIPDEHQMAIAASTAWLYPTLDFQSAHAGPLCGPHGKARKDRRKRLKAHRNARKSNR